MLFFNDIFHFISYLIFQEIQEIIGYSQMVDQILKTFQILRYFLRLLFFVDLIS